MLGKIEGKRRMGLTENEMDGWHNRLDGHEFEKTPRDGEGQGSPGMLQSTGARRVGL